MNPEIFEAVMLICFGTAWPFSIYRTWKAKSSEGKSLFFLTIILIGYLSGILFKIHGICDLVILLYISNALLVSTDILLCLKYRKKLDNTSCDEIGV